MKQLSAGRVRGLLRLGGGAEIDRLVADKDITQLCPFYVDLQVEYPRLQVPPCACAIFTNLWHLHLVYSWFQPQWCRKSTLSS